MAKAGQLDSLDFLELDFPYSRTNSTLSEEPRIIRGLNVFVNPSKSISKRPGTIHIEDADATTRPDRMLIYETLDTPPKIYLLRSAENTAGVWRVEYLDLDADTGWVSIGTLRQVNASTRPHHMAVHRGKVYIKGFPTAASGEKLGCVIFDATAGVPKLYPWGAIGPTTPARVNSPGSWNTTNTDHGFTIRQGWKYVYTFESATGHETNHSPLETNPDKNPSDTGATTQAATTGFCPEVVLGAGETDTTNWPYVNVYRSTDGGGTFYFLKQVTNTGAAQTFVDKYRLSGAGGTTEKDPMADEHLDISLIAPLNLENNPPPPVAAPKVVGTDTPEYSTRIVSWQNRLWYGIGADLFYSALEEIHAGNGEEAYPGGIRGNIFRFDSPIMQLTPTKDFLLVHTLKSTAIITGTLKETFASDDYLPDTGAPYGHPRASCKMGDQGVWITHDFRLAMAGPKGFQILSDDLFTDIVDEVLAGGELELLHWAELDHDWLLILSHRADDPTQSRQFMLNVKKLFPGQGERPRIFWAPPWAVECVAACDGRLRQSVSNRRLVFAIWNKTQSKMALVRMDATARTETDYIPGTGTGTGDVGYTWSFTTHLHLIPPGNHVNTVSRMNGVTAVHSIVLNRMKFPGDTDPSIYYFFDDLWTDAMPGPAKFDNPPRRNPSKAYETQYINTGLNRNCTRFAFQMQKIDSAELFELMSYSVIYNPGGGA